MLLAPRLIHPPHEAAGVLVGFLLVSRSRSLTRRLHLPGKQAGVENVLLFAQG